MSVRTANLVLCSILALVVINYHTLSFNYDARQYYALVQSLVEDGDVDLSNQSMLGRYKHMQFPPGLSFMVTPLAWTLDRSGTPTTESLYIDPERDSEIMPEARVPFWEVTNTNYKVSVGYANYVMHGGYMVAFAVVSLSMFLMCLILSMRMLKPGQAWIVSMLALGSPMLLLNATSFLLYASLSAMGLSCLAVYSYRLAGLSARWALLCGLACGLLFLTRYECIVFGALFIVGLILQNKFREALCLTCTWLSCILILLFYNWRAFGSPFTVSYSVENIITFGVSSKFLYWYLFHPKGGLFIYSSLMLLSLFGLVLEKERVLLVLSLSLLTIILLKINPSSDVETAGLDINRYFLVLFPFSALGFGQLVKWRRFMVLPGSGLAVAGFCLFFSLHPFCDRWQIDNSPLLSRLARDSNLLAQNCDKIIQSIPDSVEFIDGVRKPGIFDLHKSSVMFHKYGGYFGFYFQNSEQCYRGNYFNRSDIALITYLRPCWAEERAWLSSHPARCQRPF
jgi:hypothetical protein